MELLKQRIRTDGTVKGTDVLKVDSFLNHQMDVCLLYTSNDGGGHHPQQRHRPHGR